MKKFNLLVIMMFTLQFAIGQVNRFEENEGKEKSLRQTAEETDHHPVGYRDYRLFQNPRWRYWVALSKSDRSLSEGLRRASKKA